MKTLGIAFALATAGCALGPPTAEDVEAAALTSAAHCCDRSVAGTFTETGSLQEPRFGAAYAKLADGRVLVAGGTGVNDTTLASAELYDPATGQWTRTGELAVPRVRATATTLDDGRVLVAGGNNPTADNLDSAELYDPASGTFGPTGKMVWGRTLHTATKLSDGTVLLAGGYGDIDDQGNVIWTGPERRFNSAELYDPATGTFSAVANMNDRRSRHAAVELHDGTVLIAGGENSTGQLASAERYRPWAHDFVAVGNMNVPRLLETLTRLRNDDILAAAGSRTSPTSGGDEYRQTAEIYHPRTHSFSLTPAMLHARGFNSATLLANGDVLLAGGYNLAEGYVLPAELWDGSNFVPTDSLFIGRQGGANARLDDGTVLIAGGQNDSGQVADAELYHPPCR